jgi:hypothetical protein
MINAEAVRRGDAEIIENLLSEQVLDAAIEVHRTLGGPGLLESLYEDALFLDILVDRKVIIEVKAAETVLAVHKAQVLTYLRLTNLKLGLVINFGQGRLIDGWERVVNNL